MNLVPWEPAPWPDEPHAWDDHARLAGGVALPRAEHAAVYARLRAIVDGEAPADALADVLRRLSIVWPPVLRPELIGADAPPGWTPMSDREVARITLDMAPAAGDDAPRVVLGPYATSLDLLRPAHLRAWAAAVAGGAFLAHDGRRIPARAWMREGQRPPEAERRRLHAIGRAPPTAWRLVAGEGGLHAVPLLPLATAWIPRGPVDLHEVGGVVGGPVDGGLLLGRIVSHDGRAWARAAVALPVAPPERLVAGWFARLALPQLVAERGLEAEELLRRCGHRLSGFAHAWWWAGGATR